MKKLVVFAAAIVAAWACCNNQQKTAEQAAEEAQVLTQEQNDSLYYRAKVLVVVDVQKDFFDPKGSLYVPGGENITAKIAEAAKSYDGVIFTMDWHPGDHCSFKDQGGIWPAHCVQYTEGAGLADDFKPILAEGPMKVQIFLKGQEQDKEQYGAFENLDENSTIYKWLTNADEIDVCGLAGDYCVKESAKNVINLTGAKNVSVLTDLICSIDDGSALKEFINETGVNRK
ncbi:MAG: isochorismatase family protein [Bacteroidales bacterium]|nr:isochorismatase family protein [Bacteroidales bacterium]